jgi:hypothetical protein
LTRIGAISSARFSTIERSATVATPITDRPIPGRLPPVPLTNTSDPPARTFSVARRATISGRTSPPRYRRASSKSISASGA